jgi:MFS family permease
MCIVKNTDSMFWMIVFVNISFLAPVMTLFYLHRGINLQQIFLLLLVIVVTMLFFEIPTGIFGDKYGRRNSIIVGNILWVLSNVGLIFADSFFMFVFLSFLFAVGATFISGSDEAIIYDSLKEEGRENDMKKYMSKLQAAIFIPLIVTAPIGSIIAKDLAEKQFLIILILSAITSAVALIFALLLKEPKLQESKDESSNKNKNPFILFKSSFNDIKSSPVLVRLFLNKTLVLIIGAHVFGNLWQPYLLESKVPVILFGFLLSIGAIIIATLNMKIERIEKYISDRTLLYLTAILPFLAFAVGAFVRNFYFGIFFFLIISVSLQVRYPVFSHYINQHISSHNRATVLSSLSMVDSFFDVLIFISVGYATIAGLSLAFLVCAGILLIAIVFFRIGKEHVVKGVNAKMQEKEKNVA